MAADNECLDYARECVRLAELTDDPELLNQLLQMAHEWVAAAMHEKKTPKRKSRRA
jgi:NADH:ubiquinone oxidoreductase subunit D